MMRGGVATGVATGVVTGVATAGAPPITLQDVLKSTMLKDNQIDSYESVLKEQGYDAEAMKGYTNISEFIEDLPVEIKHGHKIQIARVFFDPHTRMPRTEPKITRWRTAKT